MRWLVGNEQITCIRRASAARPVAIPVPVGPHQLGEFVPKPRGKLVAIHDWQIPRCPVSQAFTYPAVWLLRARVYAEGDELISLSQHFDALGAAGRIVRIDPRRRRDLPARLLGEIHQRHLRRLSDPLRRDPESGLHRLRDACRHIWFVDVDVDDGEIVRADADVATGVLCDVRCWRCGALNGFLKHCFPLCSAARCGGGPTLLAERR